MNMAQKNISELQDFIFDQQAQVTRAIAGLSSLLDYSEKDVQLRQQQFSNWIDTLINNEKQVIADKTGKLRQALLGGTSSFLEDHVKRNSHETATENLRVLKLDLAELERRKHNLRRHHSLNVE
jgi:hypothetical protein